uniref:Uncharacterized protein n=1 Tax=Rhizophora mucronata TaxID=61149 RepID=A0A2P2M4E9_RHIMU
MAATEETAQDYVPQKKKKEPTEIEKRSYCLSLTLFVCLI